MQGTSDPICFVSRMVPGFRLMQTKIDGLKSKLHDATTRRGAAHGAALMPSSNGTTPVPAPSAETPEPEKRKSLTLTTTTCFVDIL